MANILMIIPALYCGGGLQKISLQLSQELIKGGHRIIVIDEHKPQLDKLSYLESMPIFCKLKSYALTTENYDYFSSIIKRYNIDIIIYQGFFQRVNKFLYGWKKEHKTPVISVFHNTPDAPMPKGRSTISRRGIKNIIKRILYPAYYKYSFYKVRNFLRTPYSFSKYVLLLSETFLSKYFELAGKNENILIMPNFVYQTSTHSSKRKKQILYVGRLTEEAKRFSRVLRIWEKIYNRYPDWTLIVAGEGPQREKYEKYVKDNDIDNISFLGHVSTPDILYSESSISLMTSDYEGFPLVLIEAMSQGCVPVAYQSFSSITDIIDSGINGELIEAFDEEEYTRKLEGLMQDEAYRQQLSKNAMIKAKTYSPERIIPQWEKLIKIVHYEK